MLLAGGGIGLAPQARHAAGGIQRQFDIFGGGAGGLV